jgi:hypothetical protein
MPADLLLRRRNPRTPETNPRAEKSHVKTPCFPSSLSGDTQLLTDELAESFFDLRMARNWGLLSRLRICVYVVSASMSFQIAP